MALFTRQGKCSKDPWIFLRHGLDDYREYPWFSIVPLDGLSDEHQWPLPQTWIGAWFGVDVDTRTLTKAVLELPLLNIHVEQFTDGRVFSLATRLKTSMQFRGELRVSGNFLIDQMAQLKACGVDSFKLPENSDFDHATFILTHTPERAF